MTKSCLKLNGDKLEVMVVGNNPSLWEQLTWPSCLERIPYP